MAESSDLYDDIISVKRVYLYWVLQYLQGI
jgi:hypothetical protein